MEEAGEALGKEAAEVPDKLFMRSVIAGLCVGTGGVLCSSVGGDLTTAFWQEGAGLQRFLFGAIGYPLSILMVVLTGASAFTGNLALAFNALRTGRTTPESAARALVISYAGCFVGATLVAALAAVCALPALHGAHEIVAHKVELSLTQTIMRGVGGGWLIGCAVTFASAVMRSTGRIMDAALVIWACISTYVICDFEHCLANFYFVAASLFAGGGVPLDGLLKSFFASTLGNILGAGFLAGVLLPRACGPRDETTRKTQRPAPRPAATRPRAGSSPWSSRSSSRSLFSQSRRGSRW